MSTEFPGKNIMLCYCQLVLVTVYIDKNQVICRLIVYNIKAVEFRYNAVQNYKILHI